MGRFDPGPHRFPENGFRTLALNIFRYKNQITHE